MYVAAVFVFLDLIGMGSGDRVAHEAHIGGALYGFLSAIQLKRGNDWSLRFVDLLDRLAAPFRRRKGPRLRVEKRPTGGVRPASSTAQQKQARIDAILDKISRSGYDSLSKEEKDLLFKASNDQ
jgi:hypothetical protein